MQITKEYLRNSIVRIEGKSRGTGFWVKGRNNQTYLLSCAHVAGLKGDHVDIWFHDGHKQYQTSENTPFRTEVLFSVPVNEGDIALMAIPQEHIPPDALPLQLLDVSFDEYPNCMAYGFPRTFPEHGRFAEHTNKAGKISKNDNEVPLMHIIEGREIRKGFSGGPLVHADMGYVLGMISDLETPDQDFAETIPYALPASFLSEKLDAYVEVQTLHPYKAWLTSLYHDVVLNDEKGMRLSDIYIEPTLGIYKYCINKEHTFFEKKETANGFFDVDNSIHELAASVLNGENIDFLKSNQHSVTLILGYPGQGKTSFTKRLLHDLVMENPEREIFMIRLRHIPDARQLRDNPMETIAAEIIRQADFEASITLPEKALKNAVVVLDGLDELSIKSDLGSQDVDSIVTEIIRQTAQIPGLQIVLTSRYGYVNLDKMANQKDILLLQLAEISLSQQIIWLKNYRRFHPESQLNEEKLELYHEDEKYASLKELISQPILLHLVATLEEDLINAENRAAIYTKLFDQLVSRPWSKEGATAPLLHNRTILLREALQDMAHAIFHAEKGYLYKCSLEKLPKVRELQETLDNNMDIWRSVMIAFYMDERKKGTRNEEEEDRNHDYAIEFLHKSLPEYLCAEKIWRSMKDEFKERARKMEHDLEALYDIFGCKIMTNEITHYLIEIIQNDQETNKHILAKRLLHYLDDFYAVDFLHMGYKRPIDSICAVFYGFWTVLSHINTDLNNYGHTETEGLVRLIRVVTLENYRFFNLPGADLFGSNLAGSNLAGSNLFGSNLVGSNLFGSNLAGSNLSMANLFGANLSGAALYDADLSSANLSSTNLSSTNLSSANLSSANLSNANLSNANLSNANFQGGNLPFVILSGADLSYANLSKADLSSADLSKADLSDSDLSGANLSKADLSGTNLSGTNLSGANLSGVNLFGVNLFATNLAGANLSGADLSGANLSSAEGLEIQQLQVTASLFNCVGITNWEESLLASHPHLFI